MHWFVDFILLAVLLTYSFRHFHYGLMHTVFSVAKFLVSLVLAVIFGGYVGLSLKDGYIGRELAESVYAKLGDLISATVVDTVCSVIGYVVVFLLSYLVLSIAVSGLQKIKIPILSGVDKTFGLLLGIVLGIFNASLVATAIYCALEYYAAINSDPTVMCIYTDSCVFRFIYNLKFFDFIRNLICILCNFCKILGLKLLWKSVKTC